MLGERKYLSSEHEQENDSVRVILEENDEIYEGINYMETHTEIKENPATK